ncbi:hypothetical protein DM02DRAFT_673840 [Periconia macrospinosa]|uniref:RRM domain-containing protein n=1 Tax=Periconia macrospinosa TaxID=97972 RepID=A0A2V1DHW2_9PLEO|nr:hypothetical protein DM02DRAFT_673840 [Periconia macrospinosa]
MISEPEEELANTAPKLVQASRRRNALASGKVKVQPSCTTTTPSQISNSGIDYCTLYKQALHSVSSINDSTTTLASPSLSSQADEKDCPPSFSSAKTPSELDKDWLHTETKMAAEALGGGVETRQSEFIQRALENRKALEHEVLKELAASRVIVTNIAADATTDDLFMVFHSFEPAIFSITMLSERPPIARTQTAYIDFSSRNAAVKAASCKFLEVFGLRLHSDLAVKDGETRLVFW